MPVRIMSNAELTKFEILRDVDHERMPVRAAAQVLGLTERQVWRLLKAYRLQRRRWPDLQEARPAQQPQDARRYLEQHGKPVAFYTDKHAVFRVNKPSGLHGDGMTQFGRALKALSIEIRPRAASSGPTRPCRTAW